MNCSDDPFLALGPPSLVEALESDPGPCADAARLSHVAPAVARLHGFGPDERPLLVGLRTAAGRVVPARSTVPLRASQTGRDVLVVFEDGDPTRPIVIGVIESAPLAAEAVSGAAGQSGPAAGIQLQVDGQERVVVEAQRERVLRCGAASIVLTRAGKVIIEGAYVLSRSTGYNKVKGAAIDIN